MDGAGRPSLYKPEFAEQAYGLCLAGATNQELADGFGVGHSTIDNWLRKHPEFALAVRSGRDLADAKVAHGLYSRAIGYNYEVTRILLHHGEPVSVRAHGASSARRQGLHLLAAQPPSAAMAHGRPAGCFRAGGRCPPRRKRVSAPCGRSPGRDDRGRPALSRRERPGPR